MPAKSSSPKPFIPIPILLFIGIVAISFSAIFVKWSQAPVSAVAMNRMLLTCLLMAPWLWQHRREWQSLTLPTAGRLALSGVMLGLHFLLWMESLRYTTVASSTALLTLEPIFVMIGSLVAFRQRTEAGAVFGMVVAITGAALIGWGDFRFSGPALKGDVLSVLGTGAVAVHMLIGKSLRAHVSAFVYSFAVFLAAAVVLAGYNAALGVPALAYGAKEWGIFLLLALVPTLLGHFVFNLLLKYMRATSVSMTVLGEPLGATLLAYALLGETVNAMQAAAGGILLLGVWQFMRSIGRR
jgi:drug/metabolite transporter (DMT)-like permease